MKDHKEKQRDKAERINQTLKYNRSLLLKSPPHTARIRLLLEMFPNARFVHILRDPGPETECSSHQVPVAVSV